MIANENETTVDIFGGKRHYYKQKRTSLFGSETPRVPNSNLRNLKTNTSISEDNLLTQYDILRKDREAEEKKNKNKKNEVEIADPWTESRVNAAHKTHTAVQNGNQNNWQFEREMQGTNGQKNSNGESYPGFAPGFGSGVSNTNGRMRSTGSANGNEDRQNIFYPFGSPGGGAPMSDDKKKLQGATVTIHRTLDGVKKDNVNNRGVTEQESNSLYVEAENRARMREFGRMKDAYEPYDSTYESSEKTDGFHERNNVVSDIRNRERFSGILLQDESKGPSSSATRNDYRQFSTDEFLNSRQQMINPVQMKRTTLSGSEDLRPAGYLVGSEDDNIFAKQYHGTNTFDSIFPIDRTLSASKATGPYSTKAPYATD